MVSGERVSFAPYEAKCRGRRASPGCSQSVSATDGHTERSRSQLPGPRAPLLFPLASVWLVPAIKAGSCCRLREGKRSLRRLAVID